MTKKLIKKGVLESYQKPDNKKKIYFRLTEHAPTIKNIAIKLYSIIFDFVNLLIPLFILSLQI